MHPSKSRKCQCARIPSCHHRISTGYLGQHACTLRMCIRPSTGPRLSTMLFLSLISVILRSVFFLLGELFGVGLVYSNTLHRASTDFVKNQSAGSPRSQTSHGLFCNVHLWKTCEWTRSTSRTVGMAEHV